MSFKLKLLDTKTGRFKAIESHFDPEWWAEGNGSCDCNRSIVFGREAEFGNCHGCFRYLIVEAETEEYTIEEFNRDYPDELKFWKWPGVKTRPGPNKVYANLMRCENEILEKYPKEINMTEPQIVYAAVNGKGEVCGPMNKDRSFVELCLGQGHVNVGGTGNMKDIEKMGYTVRRVKVEIIDD